METIDKTHFINTIIYLHDGVSFPVNVFSVLKTDLGKLVDMEPTDSVKMVMEELNYSLDERHIHVLPQLDAWFYRVEDFSYKRESDGIGMTSLGTEEYLLDCSLGFKKRDSAE